MVNVGERIRTARENAGLTQGELGKKIGVSKQAISQYESGIITNITIEKIQKIGIACEIDPAWIMGWEDSVKRSQVAGLLNGATMEQLNEIERYIKFVLQGK